MESESQILLQSLQVLQQVIYNRLESHFKKEDKELEDIFPSIKIIENDTVLHDFIIKNKLSVEDYLTLLIALEPHVQPNLIGKNNQPILTAGRDFIGVGGIKGRNHRGVLPTGETVLFVLCGNNLERR